MNAIVLPQTVPTAWRDQQWHRALARRHKRVGDPLLVRPTADCCDADVDEMTVTLRLHPYVAGGRAHIDGVVIADGEETSFSGWMSLLGVLEAHVDQQVLASPPR